MTGILIYSSSTYINNPKVGDLRLKVNSVWDFGSRAVCFSRIYDNVLISYDLEECIDVWDTVVVGGTEKAKGTKWQQAQLTNELMEQLESDGYTVSRKLKEEYDGKREGEGSPSRAG